MEVVAAADVGIIKYGRALLCLRRAIEIVLEHEGDALEGERSDRERARSQLRHEPGREHGASAARRGGIARASIQSAAPGRFRAGVVGGAHDDAEYLGVEHFAGRRIGNPDLLAGVVDEHLVAGA